MCVLFPRTVTVGYSLAGFLFEVDALLFAPDDVIMGGVTLKIVIVEYVD